MSSSFSSDLSSEIKQAFKKHTDQFGSKIGNILSSIFKSFMANEATISSKVNKVLEELEEADQDKFNEFYNTILKLVTYAYRERFTIDQLESELSETGNFLFIGRLRLTLYRNR
jgi:chemotaxis methyl-accepting protein methylase